MLRSARRAQRAAPAPEAADRTPMQSPEGTLGAMGTIIRKRQAELLRGNPA